MGRAAPHQRGSRAPHARQHNKCAFRRSAHPSLGMGANRQRPTRAQKRAAGTRKTVLFDIVSSRSAPLRGSHPNVSNRRRLPRRPGRARAECRAEPRVLPAPAAIHQRARALYFSCYLQVRPAGLHPSRAPPAQLYTRCRRTACMPLAGEGRGGGMWAPISSLALGKAQAGLVSRASVARPGT
jgi:hypothetical protein